MKAVHSVQAHRLSPLAVAVALALPGTASLAQQQPAEQPAQQADKGKLDTVTVTGIRASEMKALSVKRDGDGSTEVISAEDIGKLPDKNVADSLRRLPGINTTTGGGGQGGYDENDRVSMRGASSSMSIVTLNGHSVATADWDYGDMLAGGAGTNTSGSARSVSFLLLPSEIVSRAVVNKSSRADLVEGGVSGSIDIVTRRPLDLKDRFTGNLAVQAVYTDKAGKTTPKMSALVSVKNEASTAGAMLQLFSEERSLRRDGQRFNWGTMGAATAANIGNVIPAGTIYVASVAQELFEQTRKRTGGLLNLDFKVGNDLRLNLDVFRSKLKAGNERTGFTQDFGVTLNNKAAPTNVKIVDGLLTQATFGTPTGVVTDALGLSTNPAASSQNGYQTLEAKYTVNESLSVSGQLGSTKGEGKADFYEGFLNYKQVQQGYIWDGKSDHGVATTLPNGITAANVVWNKNDNNHTIASSLDKENFGQVDAEWRFTDGVVSSIKFGARAADHLRAAFRPFKAGWPVNATNTGQVGATGPGALPPYDPTTTFFPANFGGGLGAVGAMPGTMPMLTTANVQKWSDTYLSSDPLFNLPAAGPFSVKEKNKAAYVMAFLEGNHWRGNVGVRLVHTDTSVTTNTGLSCGVAGTKAVLAPNVGQTITFNSPLQTSECAPFVPAGAKLTIGTRFNNFYTATTDSDYGRTLPSASFAWDAEKDLVIRASAARTLARPEYSALGVAIGNFQYNLSLPNPSIAVGGNPKLKPIEAKVYNLAAEWYFAKASLLSVQLFKIDFLSLISAGSSTQYLFNTAARDATGTPAPAFMDTVVTQPVSAKGRSTGLEVLYQQPLWAGFGVNANYTYADAKESNGKPIVGAASDVYNLGLYFENDKFSARVSYSHSSKIRVGLFGSNDSYKAASGTVNASLGFNLTDSVSLSLEGLNLNNPRQRYYNVVPTSAMPEQTSALYSNGRQFYVGARMKF